MLVPGTYDLFSVIISLTLVAIIIGSLRGGQRSFWPSVALSAGVALSMLPLSGFLMEIVFAPAGYNIGIAFGGWAPSEECRAEWTLDNGANNDAYECIGGVAQSRVPAYSQFLAWVFWLIGALCYFGWRNREYAASSEAQCPNENGPL